MHALREVSLRVPRGRIVGIVGESGSGKSTLVLAALALLPANAEVLGGRVLFDGADVLQLPPRALRDLRGRRIAVVFQDPMTSLNPVLSIGDPDDRHPVPRARARPRATSARRASALLQRVGIPDAASRHRRLPAPVLGRHAPAHRHRDGAARPARTC